VGTVPGVGQPRSLADAEYLERFDAVMRLPLILSALLPIIISPESNGWIGATIGVVTWIVFLVDYVVHARRTVHFGRTGFGRFDLIVVILTAPWFLIPGAGAGRFVVILRLARLARLLLASKGARSLMQRIGRVLLVALGVVFISAGVAYRADSPVNSQFATYGDALWWGIVTLTTVGYGDISPTTTTGRAAGVTIMIMGIAVLGVLAGSLASFFRLQPSDGDEDRSDSPAPAFVAEELGQLADLRDRGVITDEEFTARKVRLLAS